MKERWIFRYFIDVCMTIAILSCEKVQISELYGTWVEFTNRQDTIEFDRWGSEEAIFLRRGFEFKNEYWLPKYGSGIYRYKFRPDTIKINNPLWNCICYRAYYFEFDATRNWLIIGNFYDTAFAASKHITFYRIE